jgi:chorismate mutase
VFESNPRARAFYARHGFVEVGRGDGSENEEGAPDVEMAWPDPGSVAGLRLRVDAVDDRLAALLAERAALTAAIQELKPVAGHAGRDRAREDEIVARMARLAPALGADRLRRIMQTVIAESLDAAAGEPEPGEQPPGP